MRLKILAAAAVLSCPALCLAQASSEEVPEIIVVTQASGPATSSSSMLPGKGMT